MQRNQRRTHVLLWLVVGTLTLVGFSLGISHRIPQPVQPTTPIEFEEFNKATEMPSDDLIISAASEETFGRG